ncbi:flavin reductase [Vagococcus carniphilus]|uniref:Flavin reductase n=1 Tax=Vagococcus carniphilus TaxID=218144 RepID=A0AAW8U6S5_9ENTE|nr:flavin reductase [Vagococcus carniphilus]MDT2831481.1 flavin reductase [Vagococcus carniphilus]MDT2832703.1 flavin reductase [Vagococcus carniphilus]MDT2840203.1 flavin reductase [Vagococcus carniphilus]MDT2854974.1 flavin reductase [Vagococcus carniphilus]
MNKTILDTEKLYYGFPIFILGYKDDRWGYNFTTSSSSYTLDNFLNVGLSNQGNASKQIKKHGYFTLNIPTKDYLEQIKIGGFNSGADKFKFSNSFQYDLSDKMDVPIIKECVITLECKVSQIIEEDSIVHIFSTIERRLVNSKLIKDNHLDNNLLNPILYLGDGNKRSFKFLSSE